MQKENYKPIRRMTLRACFLAGLWVSLVTITSAQIPDSPQRKVQDVRVAELISTLKDSDILKSDPQRAEAAIRELGQLRATEAIDVLVSMLDYKAYKFRKEGEWMFTASAEHAYPVVYALGEIGKPSVPAIVSLLEKTKLETQLAINARDTLLLIFIQDPTEGIDLLEAAARNSKTPEGDLRLAAAATHLRNFLELLRRHNRLPAQRKPVSPEPSPSSAIDMR